MVNSEQVTAATIGSVSESELTHSGRRKETVSANASELMMGLLKELSLLKQMDETYETGPKAGLDTVEFERRQKRREEIADQIKALGRGE